MKKILLSLSFAVLLDVAICQTGPGGVGTNDGTSSLDFWFDANEEAYNDAGSTLATNGQTVRQWNDQSGNGNNSSQGTSSYRPTFRTNIQNGFPVLDFDGSNDVLNFGYSFTSSTTIIVVAEGTYTASLPEHLLECSRPRSNSTVYVQQQNATTFKGGYWSGSADSGILTVTISNGTPFIITYNFVSSGTTEIFDMGASGGTASTDAGTTGAGTVYIGNHSSAPRFWNGGIMEIIYFNSNINSAQRIIIENYLAAKYGLSLTSNDIYNEDGSGGAGNYDFDVAGIGRVNSSNIHNDSQGTGMVRVLNPTDLDDNEYFFWGHDGGDAEGSETSDVPSGVQARLDRVWRVSETNSSNSAIDVGSVDIRFDLTGLGPVTASHLRLLVDEDNDATFSDETPISGATLVS